MAFLRYCCVTDMMDDLCSEACGHLRVRLLSQVLFYGRKLAIWLHARKPRWLLWPISAPLGCVLNV